MPAKLRRLKEGRHRTERERREGQRPYGTHAGVDKTKRRYKPMSVKEIDNEENKEHVSRRRDERAGYQLGYNT